MKKIIALVSSLPLATFGFAGVALADDEGNTYVSNNNSAYVLNVVTATSNTGGNAAGGSTGGNGGNAGDISNSGDDVDDSSTGDGGNGGNGGYGGTVVTGEASAEAGVINSVNTNETKIDRRGCDCKKDNDVEGDDVVENNNVSLVGTSVGAQANTGINVAVGSEGGKGGKGGAIDNSGDDVEDSHTGNGGHGGTGGPGGLVKTGPSYSRAGVVNVIGTNITRILR